MHHNQAYNWIEQNSCLGFFFKRLHAHSKWVSSCWWVSSCEVAGEIADTCESCFTTKNSFATVHNIKFTESLLWKARMFGKQLLCTSTSLNLNLVIIKRYLLYKIRACNSSQWILHKVCFCYWMAGCSLIRKVHMDISNTPMQ